MSQYPRAFEAFGFTIEVHAGGRRFWPPSFKRHITSKLESGELTVCQVMDKCNVSKSLVYKWRSDVKDSKILSVAIQREMAFSDILVDEEALPSIDDEEVCWLCKCTTCWCASRCRKAA